MKNTAFIKLALLFVVITSLFAACSKGTTVKPSATVSSEIFGKWEERSASGGLNGYDTTYAAGNGNMFLFSSDSTYKQYAGGRLFLSGTYHINKFSQSGSDFIGTLYFNTDTQYGQAIELRKGQLILGTSAADGIAAVFTKIDDE